MLDSLRGSENSFFTKTLLMQLNKGTIFKRLSAISPPAALF